MWNRIKKVNIEKLLKKLSRVDKDHWLFKFVRINTKKRKPNTDFLLDRVLLFKEEYNQLLIDMSNKLKKIRQYKKFRDMFYDEIKIYYKKDSLSAILNRKDTRLIPNRKGKK